MGVATMLQAPVYTFFKAEKVPTSLKQRWLKYPPLQPAMKVDSDYNKESINLLSCPNLHLELLHFEESHYDLVIPGKGQ